MSSTTEFAAIDLGTNSFHMVVAMDAGGIKVVDRDRVMVRLGAGMDQSRRILPEVEKRALECLARFRDRIRDLDQRHVRVVGTNALRKAENASTFIATAQQVLGFDIEVISGIDEARLIYNGVNWSLPEDKQRRMVIDIGGGSTEIIVGEGEQFLDLESLEMGCVTYTQKFFESGSINPQNMAAAISAAEDVLEPLAGQLLELSAVDNIGSSGTARAIEKIVTASGWSQGGINKASLDALVDRITSSGHSDRLELEGLSEERRPVIAGGVAVMFAIFESLKLDQLEVSDGALREGTLLELIEDFRRRT